MLLALASDIILGEEVNQPHHHGSTEQTSLGENTGLQNQARQCGRHQREVQQTRAPQCDDAPHKTRASKCIARNRDFVHFVPQKTRNVSGRMFGSRVIFARPVTWTTGAILYAFLAHVPG